MTDSHSPFFNADPTDNTRVAISASRVAVEGSIVLRPCQTEAGCVNSDQQLRCAGLAGGLTLTEVASQVCPIDIVEGASHAA